MLSSWPLLLICRCAIARWLWFEPWMHDRWIYLDKGFQFGVSVIYGFVRYERCCRFRSYSGVIALRGA